LGNNYAERYWFLINKYSNYIPTINEIAKYLRRWKEIGPRLKKEEILENRISKLSPGIWVLLFVESTSNASEKIRTHLGINRPRPGKFVFIEVSEITTGINDLIREEKLFPLKFLYRG